MWLSLTHARPGWQVLEQVTHGIVFGNYKKLQYELTWSLLKRKVENELMLMADR